MIQSPLSFLLLPMVIICGAATAEDSLSSLPSKSTEATDANKILNSKSTAKEKAPDQLDAELDVLLADLSIGPRAKPEAKVALPKVIPPAKAPAPPAPAAPLADNPKTKTPAKSGSSSHFAGGPGALLLGFEPGRGREASDSQRGYYVSRANDQSSGILGVDRRNLFAGQPAGGSNLDLRERGAYPVLSLPIGLPTLSIASVPGFTVTSDASIDWRVIGVPMPGFGPGNLVLPYSPNPQKP